MKRVMTTNTEKHLEALNKKRQEIIGIYIKKMGYKITIKKHSKHLFDFSDIISESIFKTKKQALKFAKAYMIKH